ncbi:uncharacterized protein PHACADRAFT_248105 [Phanerochaete carnosa HHB-10118-sp]|uniref:DUF292-domain-containing protein n=1 Tax=Phanerochaete carnosa (strain HHB-10118-sp) TaxID=650164 RepID=K5WQF5_PHACS|nr:uncharacterized protein PHACADRAFT_248105 [Phanerochaete carnosa HHB-10118-sp]EKM61469.1 hypothetical protein PHACADRAFT_248105 [Phanerochaete carnosa HHB-10118-sp]
MVPWNSAKAKVQLRLGVQRLRTLQEKKAAQAKASRRDIAMLIEKGKLETARIKVENIINEDIYVELLELLELYCELLLARFGLIDQPTREPDPGVSEGVCAIIYAAPRTELKELHVLRDILMHKYGRDFSIAVMENKDGCVSERVAKKLATLTPSQQLVDAYLSEIAKGYNIAWTPPNSQIDAGGDNGEGGTKEKIDNVLDTPLPSAETISAEARSNGARTPKLPELPPTEDEGKKEHPKAEPPEDDFDTLAKRFAALKKR